MLPSQLTVIYNFQLVLRYNWCCPSFCESVRFWCWVNWYYSISVLITLLYFIILKLWLYPSSMTRMATALLQLPKATSICNEKQTNKNKEQQLKKILLCCSRKKKKTTEEKIEKETIYLSAHFPPPLLIYLLISTLPLLFFLLCFSSSPLPPPSNVRVVSPLPTTRSKESSSPGRHWGWPRSSLPRGLSKPSIV